MYGWLAEDWSTYLVHEAKHSTQAWRSWLEAACFIGPSLFASYFRCSSLCSRPRGWVTGFYLCAYTKGNESHLILLWLSSVANLVLMYYVCTILYCYSSHSLIDIATYWWWVRAGISRAEPSQAIKFRAKPSWGISIFELKTSCRFFLMYSSFSLIFFLF